MALALSFGRWTKTARRSYGSLRSGNGLTLRFWWLRSQLYSQRLGSVQV